MRRGTGAGGLQSLSSLGSAAAATGSDVAATATGREPSTAAILLKATAALTGRAVFRTTATAVRGSTTLELAELTRWADTALLNVDGIVADLVRVGVDGGLEAGMSGEVDKGTVLFA